MASEYSGIAWDATISERIADVRAMQTELRSRPVTGSMRSVKKMFYQLVRSTFSRQHALNAATLDLIETIYRQAETRRVESPQADAGTLGAFAPIPKAAKTTETLASSGQMQDQAALNGVRELNGFKAVYSAPAEMRMPERAVLYGLLFGLQPKSVLEIGSFRGGSTAIMCGALDDTGYGQISCVDPLPQIDEELWRSLQHRCRMFVGASPDILSGVAKESGGQFDFALIDGGHTYDDLRRDIEGVLPVMTDSAYLLFHDAHYDDVKRAIDEAVAKHRSLTDCGMLSVEPTVLQQNGQTVRWAGLRLLRFQRS